jgi:hypothetical protein
MSLFERFLTFEERRTLQGSRGHQWTDHEPAETHLHYFSHQHNKSYPITNLDRLLGLQEVEAP